MSNQTPVAEIVAFRLLPGASKDAFIAEAHTVENALSVSDQMLARTLSCTDQGDWTDHVVWASAAAAQTAAAEVMSSKTCATFMSMIDPDSVQMRHDAVAHRMD